MMQLSWTVFEPLPIANYYERHVSSCAMSNVQKGRGKRRFFTGTSDGALSAYYCREEILSGYEATMIELMRTPTRDRSCVSQLATFDAQAVLFAIVDGIVVAYDTNSLRATAHVRDARGVLFFSAHAPSRTLILFLKKRIKVYVWQRGGILKDVKREYTLPETPSSACLVNEKCVIIANKRSFDILMIDLGDECNANKATIAQKKRGVFSALGVSNPKEMPDGSSPDLFIRKLLDAPGGTGPSLILSGNQSSRNDKRLLVSSQSRGVLFNLRAISAYLTLPSKSVPNPTEERIAWSSAPIVLKTASAFVLALLESTIEVIILLSHLAY
tara:strand:- start:3002 stop:3985 length:984 start_codon:yes stop_codon:yes gene_type:complete